MVIKLKTKFGNEAKEQYVDTETNTFYSYGTKIAGIEIETNELILYDENWDYSFTTRYYFKQFINSYCSGYEYVNKTQWLKEIMNNDNIKVV